MREVVARRRKIPTKSELIQLQQLYKTDERIGERLGGVPAYLVAYWRRKKGVPKHSLPKFSEKEIRTLWERFGNDDRCGLELGISKPAFYNWRRRYGIREKPAFLKLEQLELSFPGIGLSSRTDSLYGERSLVHKLMACAAGGDNVESGQTILIEPVLALSRNDTAEVIGLFNESGAEYVFNPNRIAIALSPILVSQSVQSSRKLKLIRDFARRQSIRSFFDMGEGVGHQVAMEHGLILPGQVQAATNAYACSFGAVAGLASHIDSQMMADLWVKGQLSVDVPRVTQVTIDGRRVRGVYSRDVAAAVVRDVGRMDTPGRALEFCGATIPHMSVSERFTLCRAAVDAGCSFAVCRFDSVTRRYLSGRAIGNYQPLFADKDAVYDDSISLSVDGLSPQLIGGEKSHPVLPVAEREDQPVHQIVLGTECCGRFEDLRVAADMLKGKKVHPDCRLLVFPGSRSVYIEALKKGLIRVFVEAGAMVMNPSSGADLAGLIGSPAPGERWLATADVSLLNATDTSESELYLCSPATAAASALNASITDPTRYIK